MDRLSVDINIETALIGHSCGAGFLVRWLCENRIRVGKVAFVAPFLDPDRDEVAPDFFNFIFDKGVVERSNGMAVFIAPEDDREIIDSARIITEKIPGIHTISLPGRGHFTIDSMKTDAFPELLDFLLN
jgi:predicted alpha/beta hydrolase family esterase